MQNRDPFLFLLFLAIAAGILLDTPTGPAGIPFFGLVRDESPLIILLDVRLPRSPAGVPWTPEVPHVGWVDQSADDLGAIGCGGSRNAP